MTEGLFSREEVLGGLPARRAATLLYLIQSRTGHMVAQARQAMEICLTQDAEQERELAFLEAFAQGREPPLRPTIQDLERYATAWSDLVPSNGRIRAALAHAFSERYSFTYADVPRIRQALDLDSESVSREYNRLYRSPLQSIYARGLSPLARARWSLARLSHWLETLPPFWTAFSLTLTETVGAGIMGLPIGVAELGLIPGLILLVVFGVVNIITIACISESVARSGTIRYGETYIGKLIEDYLGAFASTVTSGILVLLTALALIVFYVGLSTTLEHTIHLPALVGTALVFAAGIILITRKSLSATVSSALIIGVINMILILIMCALALPHLQASNLTYVHVPFFRGVPFESAVLATIFGIILAAYFGHLSMGNCARVVLQRDPSARSFMLGGMTAQAAAMTFYCIWVFSINGALSHQSLAGQYSTALVPLTQLVGPVIVVVGTIYVALAMGMASVSMLLALRNLIRERLPYNSTRVLSLQRGTGVLVFRPSIRRRDVDGRDSTHLGLAYLGVQRGQPRFRLALTAGTSSIEHVTAVRENWSDADVPDLASSGAHLSFEVVDAQKDSVVLRVSSAWKMGHEGDWVAEGVHVSDILELAEPDRRLLQWVMRQGRVSQTDIAARVSGPGADTQQLVSRMVEQGLLEQVEGTPEPQYRAHLGRPHKSASGLSDDIWAKLEGSTAAHPVAVKQGVRRFRAGSRVRHLVGTERGRNLVSMIPLLLLFGITEVLLYTKGVTFAGVLNLVGIIAISVFAGMFPTLLLVSARHKGDYVPRLVFRILGWPPVVVGVYLLFLANLFVHGIIIWQEPFERVAAITVGLLIVLTTMVMLRGGAFHSRVIVELYTEDTAKDTSWRVTAAGRPLPVMAMADHEGGPTHLEAASGLLPAIDALQRVAFHLPASAGSELKVWAHRITPGGTSEALPASVTVGGRHEPVDLQLNGGQVVLPLTGTRSPGPITVVVTCRTSQSVVV
jgi:amino acid permease